MFLVRSKLIYVSVRKRVLKSAFQLPVASGSWNAIERAGRSQQSISAVGRLSYALVANRARVQPADHNHRNADGVESGDVANRVMPIYGIRLRHPATVSAGAMVQCVPVRYCWRPARSRFDVHQE